MRALASRSRIGWARAPWRSLEALLILSLLVSLIAPLAPVAAAQDSRPLPPPLPAPFQVSLSGSFQTALGCPVDFDPSCPQTQLQDNRDGSWSAILPIPPGDYSFRVVASSNAGASSLGEGGDPNGGDLVLSVPGDDAGAYFRYDSLTGTIAAEPVSNLVTLVTDLGEEFPMAPIRQGGYRVAWDAQQGNYGFQVLFNGEVVTQDSVSLDNPRRVVVAVDDAGAVTTKETLRGTTLGVSAVDAAGNPRPGSCFAILDRENRLRAQACDGDDGQEDGFVTVRVPDGLDEGNYTLRETGTAEGSRPAEEQRVGLGPGRSEVTAASAGEAPVEDTGEEPAAEETPEGAPDQAVVEPGEQPGRLTVVAVDAAGQPLPGACFAVVEFGFGLCDDNLDGTIVFDAVPPGTFTLRQTTPPAGFAPVADLAVTVEPTGARVLVPHEAASEEPPTEPEETPAIAPVETPPAEPAETPQAAIGTGQVALTARDPDGNLVSGACWALTNRDSGESFERCDGDDGMEDGRFVFDNVPAGRYRLEETTTPPGFQPASAASVDVAEGQTSEVELEYRPARGQLGRLVILVADEAGNPLGQSCFDLDGPLQLADVCDRQDDGRLNVPDLPAGEYTVTQTQAAEGFTPAAETEVTVPEDATVELPLVNLPAGADQGQAAPVDAGQVEVTLRTDDGTAVPDACVALDDGSTALSVCDDTEQDEDGEPGRVTLAGIAPGDYTLSVDAPEGFTAPGATPIQVVAGETARFEIVLTSTAVEEPVAQTGRLSILAEDEAGTRLPGGCYTLEIGGQVFGPFCDEDNDGLVLIEGITPGPLAAIEDTPPAGAEPSDPARIDAEIVAGEEARIVFRPAAVEQEQEEPQNGIVEVRVVDGTGQPVAACVELSGDEGSLSVCDNREQDEDAQLGLFRIRGIPAGTYTVTLSGLAAGLPVAEPQEAEVVAGETTTVDFTLASGLGALVIFVEDEAGQRRGGACFTLDGEATVLEDVCDQGDDGRLNFPDLPSGEYIVIQTRAAENRQIAAEQTVTVEPGQTVEITVLNPLEVPEATPTPEPTAAPEPEATATPEPEATAEPTPGAVVEQPAGQGTFTVVNLDPEGNLLGGSCFSLTNAANEVIAERCDNAPDDFDNAPGVIAFGGLPEGPYTLSQTRAPEGFTAAAPVAVGQGLAPTTVDVVSGRAAQETGTVELAAFSDDGSPLTGQCYTLAGSAGTFGPFCDNGEGDSSADPGVLVIEGLPTGTYEAILEISPDTADVELQQAARQRRSVSVRRGDRPTRVRFDVRAQQNQRGSLLIRVRDVDGDYLAGACFALISEGETNPAAEVCDNRRSDENSSDGRILLSGFRAGRYTLTQTTAPDGFTAAADQVVRVPAGDVREVAVTNRAQPERTADLTVETIDPEANLLPGACYAAIRGNTTLEACDSDDGGNGLTAFADIAAGSYVVRQIQAPSGGFTPAGDTAARIDPGQSATVTVTNERRPGSLLIRKTDEAGQLLGGACFALRQENRNVYTVCDNEASDGNRDNGLILLGTIAPGAYGLRETRSPAGYLTAADQEITVNANQRAQVTVADAPVPRPERVGDLRVFKLDTQGEALAGSCFALIDGNGQPVSPTCDADDGNDDGTVLIEGVGIGEYTLRETRRPSAGFETAPDQTVEIIEGQTVDVEVENRLRPGRILIRKFNPNGSPLADACFDLLEDGAGATCTDVNGELLVANLVPGTYRVVETRPAPGYLPGPALDPVTVRPGSTATLDLVNEPEPAPPDSGSLQVMKFLCPVAEGNTGIVFVDSSDPDGGGLARTAGCVLGDAAFALDGPSGPLKFRTGATGRYQTTLEPGAYVLTELTTGAAEELTVSVNVLTTVVAVNYVEPDTTEPAAIDVIKYTCAPGFQGRVWLDFAEGCLAEENLTNNVNFRLTGPLSSRRVTGDTGIGGTTRFDGLPAGEYRLREEVPAGTVAVYAFCGLDANAPDGRAVGNVVGLQLSSGQNVTCSFFNVTEDLTASTGALTVFKFACPVTVPPTGYDWYGRCSPQGQGVQFSLSIWDGAQFVPVTTAATDADGILRLTRLQPGVYDLQEVDAVWCKAESDSVNAQGNVVIEAGARASVWIFDCVGAKRPPNTGAGPMWSGAVPAAPGAFSGIGVGLGLFWPLVGLGVLRRRR